MNRIEAKLKELNPILFSALQETKNEVDLLLQQYLKNFPEYTDHSINHTQEVFNIVDEILTKEELDNLNADEIYVLASASYLHDVGMCIPEEKIKEIADTNELLKHRELHPEITRENFLRDIHHELSRKFIEEEWDALKIPNKNYANAIGLVAEGHRKVDIGNPEIYEPKKFCKSGREFVCLPYLSAILRIADELDITNIRTPKLLTKYYMPDNEKSIEEWSKHIANTQRNITEDYVKFEVECTNHQMLSALEDQFSKIRNVINYCQKVIRNISNTEDRKFSLKLDQVREKYDFIDFDPKGIKYSFDVEKVIDAFVGENLYNDKFTSLREVIQNAIDTCRYKKVLEGDEYTPEVKIIIEEDKIIVEDNGLGMDEFIIKNFFGKLGSSFYQQENVKKDYDAIGNFGVGVFSYFLMSDYIDIETKTKDSETLHFRLDKDPKNYFHFFKEYKRDKTGTTITLYLKDDLRHTENSKFLNYIENIFCFIEFPIKIIINNSEIFINKQNYSYSNINKILRESLSYKYRNFKDINILEIEINNSEYEGVATFLFQKDFSSLPFDIFKNDSALLNNQDQEFLKKIYQKGVFVTNYDHDNENSVTLNYLLKLNLLKKINLQINRNDFSNYFELNSILNDISIKIYNEIFEKFISKTEKNKISLYTLNLLENIGIESNYYRNIENKIFFNCIIKSKEKLLSLNEIVNNYNKIFFSLNNEETKEIIKKNKDILVINFANFTSINFSFGVILGIFREYKYNKTIVKDFDNTFLILDNDINKKIDEKSINYRILNCICMENINTVNFNYSKYLNKKYTPKSSLFNSMDFLNFNHPFINRLINGFEKNIINKDVYEELLDNISSIRYHFKSKPDIFLKEINDLIVELDLFDNKNINLKLEDFDL